MLRAPTQKAMADAPRQRRQQSNNDCGARLSHTTRTWSPTDVAKDETGMRVDFSQAWDFLRLSYGKVVVPVPLLCQRWMVHIT